jgi:hypothetical protein
LRYSGSSRPNNSDSSELLREKDQEIEMVIIKHLIQTLFNLYVFFILL